MLMASFIGKAMNFWFMSFQVPSWSLKKQISLFRSALSWFRSGSMIFQNASESRVFPNLVVHPPGKIRVQLDHENLFASTACWCQRVRPIGMLMFNDVYSVNLKIWMCMFYWEVHYPGNLTAIGTSPVNYRTQLLKWYIIPLATTSFSIAKCTC